MSTYVIAQREYFTEGPKASPAVFDNLGRYRSITFLGASITKVEGSIDGSTFVDVTSQGQAVAGAILFQGLCFPIWRVTASGDVRVAAN